MLKAKISYPKKQEERDIVRMNLSGAGMPEVGKVITPEDIVKARKVVEDVYMDEKIEKYIIDIIFATREPAEYNLQKLQNLIAYGGSPRASISLAKAARAYAFIRRRGYVIPEDVRAVCHDVLRLSASATASRVSSKSSTSNWMPWASSSGLRFSRCRFSMSCMTTAAVLSASFISTGTSRRPAMRAATKRRSPAMISCVAWRVSSSMKVSCSRSAGRRRTSRGWSTP
jgi:MoxR-like ATPase